MMQCFAAKNAWHVCLLHTEQKVLESRGVEGGLFADKDDLQTSQQILAHVLP